MGKHGAVCIAEHGSDFRNFTVAVCEFLLGADLSHACNFTLHAGAMRLEFSGERSFAITTNLGHPFRGEVELMNVTLKNLSKCPDPLGRNR